MTLTRKKAAIAAGILVLIVAALVAIQAIWHPFSRSKSPLSLRYHEAVFDIHYPDVVIDSAALSKLPRDMIRVPLLQSLLTQDFVDYYEATPARMSAEGTVRRLAFEYEELDWKEGIVERVFDEPSRVLLWRSPDGRLGYWAIAMQRNGLARLLQGLGNVAAGDEQLSQVGELAGDAPVYALKLSVGHTLLFAAKGDRLLLLSEPGMLFDSEGDAIGEREKVLAKMLNDGGDEVLRTAYGLDKSAAGENGHSVIVSANYLSFGYQTFFPGINALRFDFSASDERPEGKAAAVWRTAALIDAAHLPQQQWDSADLWRALPANAAACASLPVDWNAATDLLDKLEGDKKVAAAALRDQFTGVAGACWYAKSTLVAPVFVAQLKPDAAKNPAIKKALASAFEDMIGAYETNASNDNNYRRLPVQASDPAADVARWMRPVSAHSGTERSAGSPYAAQLSAPRYFPVTLALAHGYVVFSPDARLVDDTLAVLDKRYPAIADTLAPQRLATTVMMVTPSTSAALVEREAGRALPADQEATFRNAASTHLLPKLHAVAEYAPFSLSLPETLPSGANWVPVEWFFDSRAGKAPLDDAEAAQALRGGLTGGDE